MILIIAEKLSFIKNQKNPAVELKVYRVYFIKNYILVLNKISKLLIALNKKDLYIAY